MENPVGRYNGKMGEPVWSELENGKPVELFCIYRPAIFSAIPFLPFYGPSGANVFCSPPCRVYHFRIFHFTPHTRFAVLPFLPFPALAALTCYAIFHFPIPGLPLYHFYHFRALPCLLFTILPLRAPVGVNIFTIITTLYPYCIYRYTILRPCRR